MNDVELTLIPLWEIIIERNILTPINYIENKSGNSIKNYTFIKSVLEFVPTVSSFYCYSFKNNNGFHAELLTEALKHSMSSVAVENPKLYLEWTPRKFSVVEKQDTPVDEVLK